MMPRGVDVVDEYLTARRMLGLAADEIAGIAPKFLLHSATPQRHPAATEGHWLRRHRRLAAQREGKENPSSSPRSRARQRSRAGFTPIMGIIGALRWGRGRTKLRLCRRCCPCSRYLCVAQDSCRTAGQTTSCRQPTPAGTQRSCVDCPLPSTGRMASVPAHVCGFSRFATTCRPSCVRSRRKNRKRLHLLRVGGVP